MNIPILFLMFGGLAILVAIFEVFYWVLTLSPCGLKSPRGGRFKIPHLVVNLATNLPFCKSDLSVCNSCL